MYVCISFRVSVYTRDRVTTPLPGGAFPCVHVANVDTMYIYVYTYIYAYVYVYRSPGKWLGVSVSVAYESGPYGILRTRLVRICMCVSWLFRCPRCGRMAHRSTFSFLSLSLSFSSSILLQAYHELVSLRSQYRVRVLYTRNSIFTRPYLKIYSPQDGCRPN